MGTIVKNWIINKLGLEIPQTPDPSTFRYEVANGVLIAEILRKYGLLSDDEFISLRHNNSSKSRIENMRHVHKWLTNAGMDLDEDLMTAVAEEKHGSAIKFLYELFLWLEDGPRKPNVGEKAKKYLTEHRSSDPKSTEQVKQQRRKSREGRLSVLSSTWLHSLQKRESEPSDDPLQPPKIHLKHKSKKQSNWFTTSDPLTFEAGKSDPYNELSEAAQAEAVYFAQKTVEILRDQEKLKNEIRAIQRKKLDAAASIQDEAEEIRVAALGGCTFRTQEEIVADRISRAKQQEKAVAEQEIKEFDAKMKGKDRGPQNTIMNPEKIYRFGKGCDEHYQKSLQQLKCRRQKEVRAANERNKRRKTALSKIIQEIPHSIFADMQNEVLKLACTSLSTSEQLLADFIHSGHQEKSSFKQHAYFDAIQRQNARNFDLEKAAHIEQEENDLKKAILEYKYEQPVKLISYDGEGQDQPGPAEKLAIAQHILENAMELVSQMADYRISIGPTLDTKLFNEISETDEFVPKIVLQNDHKFVLEMGSVASQEEDNRMQMGDVLLGID